MRQRRKVKEVAVSDNYFTAVAPRFAYLESGECDAVYNVPVPPACPRCRKGLHVESRAGGWFCRQCQMEYGA
jgi:tRNA(Ile2) C34 agmatinyltransferase TiaS